MAKFIKFKNCRRSFFTVPYVQGLKLLGGAFGGNIRKDLRMVTFKDNCQYSGSREDSLNILFGYKLGRKNSVYLGWRYISADKQIQIFAAYIIDNVYSERFLMSAEFNKAYIMGLTVNWDKAEFKVSCETALDRGYKMHVTIPTGGMGMTDSFVLLNNWCISKGMAPSIGNIKTRPEGVMEVRVEKI